MSNCLIIYRGPLQRSRLSLILSCYSKVFKKVDFVWLVPHPKFYQKQHFFDFIGQFGLDHIDSMDASIWSFVKVRLRLSKKQNEIHYNRLVFIGTTSIFFSSFSSNIPRDFFVNGIPEERFFHNSNLLNRSQVLLIWKFLSMYSVDRVFSVSKYMSEYLKKRIKAKNYFSIPSGIYHNQGKEKLGNGTKMVYSGSGAPWQWLSRLSLIWQEIHHQDSSIEFIVVSRDPRSKILSEGINPNCINFVEGSSGEEVFNLLQQAKLGFLIREDHLVNQVSFPIKFGEYLAAGLHVIVSDFDWECAEFVKINGGGFLISNNDLINESKKVLDFFYSLKSIDRKRAQELSYALSMDNSKSQLIEILNDN